MKATQLITLLIALLLAPAIACANGGLPIIFLLNAYAFFIGSIFVIAIEVFYLRKLVEEHDRKLLLRLVIKFNIFSTLFGVIALPIFIAIVQLEPIAYMIQSGTTEETMTFVWWASLSTDLLLAYFGTVLIEYRTLKRSALFKDKYSPNILKKHVFLFNLYSYLFLILIILLTYGYNVY
jgi:hypothetical protein